MTRSGAGDNRSHDLAVIGEPRLCQRLVGQPLRQLVAQWQPAGNDSHPGADGYWFLLGRADQHSPQAPDDINRALDQMVWDMARQVQVWKP